MLRYRTPAAQWTDGLPIGNGRLGAMLLGRPGHDRWQINDDTCWSGHPGSTSGVQATDEPSPPVIERVRELILAGDLTGADAELRKVQYGHSQAYQPLADLEVVVGGADHAPELTERRLDLRDAVASWTTEDGPSASVFASAPAGAIIGRYHWPEPVDMTVRVIAAHESFGVTTVRADGDELVLTSRMPTDVHPPHDRAEDPISYDPTPGHAVSAALATKIISDGQV